MGFIYKLTLKKESRKAYIGQTIRDIHKRLEEHQLESSGCRAISSAIKKHGWDNFDKEWYEVPDEDLNFYEEMLVALLGTLAPGGYNLMEGGGSTGKRSEETKQKMSEAMTGEKHPMYGKTGEKHPMYGKMLTEETKKKISKAKSGEKNPMFGKEHTDETKQKISEALSGEKAFWYGKTHTEESKQKMSEAKSGKAHTDETKRKMSKAKSGEKNTTSKKVYQYNLDGTYVHSYASSGEAARSLGKTDGSSISKCARGKRPSAYGFKWS
ncbi:hypothetical protein MT325_M370R [Paramecium bursaria chlorella virus MT325]|uniref:Uncharacterized protein M370R n=1 Tax=Paramecium bursaria Chlorella virus MT325 TaxID=346932 RepID=A7IUA0_PBCVM|nr:hypothetical protein MT325_M370R [Paramecium bursaria chlorella virus MT325]